MRGAWARKYDALTPEATKLLHAVTLLGTTDPGPLGAAFARDPADVRRLLDRLTSAGWLAHLPDGRLGLADAARFWLTHDAPRHVGPAALHADDALHAARLLDYHAAKVDLGANGLDEVVHWIHGHRAELIVAVRAGVENGLHERALAVVRAAWDVAHKMPDADWHRELAEAGELAARDPGELLDQLHRGAHTALSLPDLETAEHHYGRAAVLALQLGDRDAAANDLAALARVLLDRDQAPRAVDVLLELADLHRAMDDRIELATTLTRLGALTLAGDRPDLAAVYLEEADALLEPLAAAQASSRSRANELRGRALWSLGNSTLARRAFRLAEQLAEPDDLAVRERLRVLLTLSRGAPLPPMAAD